VRGGGLRAAVPRPHVFRQDGSISHRELSTRLRTQNNENRKATMTKLGKVLISLLAAFVVCDAWLNWRLSRRFAAAFVKTT